MRTIELVDLRLLVLVVCRSWTNVRRDRIGRCEELGTGRLRNVVRVGLHRAEPLDGALFLLAALAVAWRVIVLRGVGAKVATTAATAVAVAITVAAARVHCAVVAVVAVVVVVTVAIGAAKVGRLLQRLANEDRLEAGGNEDVVAVAVAGRCWQDGLPEHVRVRHVHAAAAAEAGVVIAHHAGRGAVDGILLVGVVRRQRRDAAGAGQAVGHVQRRDGPCSVVQRERIRQAVVVLAAAGLAAQLRTRGTGDEDLAEILLRQRLEVGKVASRRLVRNERPLADHWLWLVLTMRFRLRLAFVILLAGCEGVRPPIAWQADRFRQR
mmetsp:Transcript_7128/g.21023  ORF Transcript_7128/g.21023 Transcript_7128/m.21023 type:complete len:323 (+) Transcript_7128:331-1299(+)